MPKEVIPQLNRHGDPDTTVPAVRVGWSKEADYVQLATVHKDYEVLEPTPEGNGWFVDLDRTSINRLIKVLRKARDQAYGRDE